jgi:hypothetical protein
MMKSKVSYIIFLSLVMTVVLAVGVLTAEDTEAYVNEDLGFSFDYPGSWKNANVKGGNIVVMFTGGAINRNIQVLHDTGGAEAGQDALQRLAEILKTQKELTAEWRDVDGRRAFFQVVEWNSPLGDTRAVRLMVPEGDRYFLVMGVCPAGDFTALGPLLTKCVLSFRITE